MAISVQGLAKTFRVGLRNTKVEAVRQVDLKVEDGEIFGFVGPNGAGKSTTIHMLLGLVRPSAGSGQILGAPLGSIESRKKLGYLPELPNFYGYLQAQELLDMSGRLGGLQPAQLRQEIPLLLERVGLSGCEDKLLRTFSKGMLQRVGLAQAIMGKPALVILDEPMSGLDPIGRHLVRQVILDLRAAGTTVFFSSHVMPDVEALCDRVSLVAQGRSIKTGRVEDLVREGQDRYSLQVRTSTEAPSELPGLIQSQRSGDTLNLVVHSGPAVQEATRWAQAQGELIALIPVHRSLESIVVDALAAQEPEETTP